MPTDQNQDLENVPEFIQKQAAEALNLLEAAKEGAAAAGLPLGGEKEPDAEEAPALETPAPEEEVDPAAIVTEEMTKEQRYKVLEGMQRKQSAQWRQEREAYEAELAQLRAAKTAPAPAPAAAPVQVDDETIQRLTEAFGQQSLQDLDAFLRTRGYVKSDDLKTVKDEMNRVATTVQSTSDEAFFKEMDMLTDGRWRAQNKQQWFIDHMNEEEGNTGMSRLEFAKKHLAERNAPKLAHYFLAAKPPGASAAPKLDKKRLSSPPSTPAGGRSTGGGDNEVPEVTKAEMEQFSRDVINGRYAGRDAEVAAFQSRIAAAAAVGRAGVR